MSYKHLGAPPFASGVVPGVAPGGDYMALPSMRRMRSQADAIVTWLERAQAKQRPLEDWVETKIARTSSDIDDVHNFVVNSDTARMGLSGFHGAAGFHGVAGVACIGNYCCDDNNGD